MSKHMNRNTHPFKAFLYGMGFGALLMFILLFPGQLKAFDENNDVYCMAQNIYFEAGNQPLAGKIAVAQVVLNRLEHPNYPTWKLRNRLLALSIFEPKCSCCGYEEKRVTDNTVPLLLDHKDGDITNHRLDNLQLLCLNCYYTQVGNPFNEEKEHFWNYNLLQ